MATSEPASPAATPLRARIGATVIAVALAATLALSLAVLLPGWFDRLPILTGKAASRSAPQAKGSLDNAVRYVRALPARAGTLALAAQGTQEGHWRFVNRAGEMFTVGAPEEMKSVVAVLYPTAKAGARLALYLTEDTSFRDPAAFKALPAGTDLYVVIGHQSYRVVKRPEGTGERFFAEVSPNLVVEIGDRRLFEEAAWQLSRPLDKARVRILALEPGGPSTLYARPRFDPATQRAQVDVVDPASLAAAIGSVRGQTLLVTGRIDGELLYVKPYSGPERSLLVKDLLQAAADADVNLIVLQATPTPRQPGGRNWLWLSVEVQGLDKALQRARLVDFLNVLGGQHRRLVVSALPVGDRTALDVSPIADLPGSAPGKGVGDFFAAIVADIAGRVATTTLQASLRSAARQQELDRRVVPGISTDVQLAYLVLLIVGLLGVPVSRDWWQRIWPPEMAGEYAGRSGYWAACAVRALAFALAFMPVTAVVAAPYNLARQIREVATAPVRAWRRLRDRKAGPGAPPPVPQAPAGLAAPSLATPSDSASIWREFEAASSGRDRPVPELPGLDRRLRSR
jgi:hypothetical protein